MTPPENRSPAPVDLTALLVNFATVLGLNPEDPSRVELAFRWLEHAITGTIYRMAASGGFSQDRDDALQEVMIKVIQATAHYRPDEGGRKSFFRRVAVLKMRTWMKRQQRNSADNHAVGTSDELIDAVSAPAEDNSEEYREVLALLPVRYHKLVELRLRRATSKEIAEILKIKPSTIRQQLARLRKVMTRLLSV